MSALKHPSVLLELSRAGESGIARRSAPAFQRELDLCRQWGFRLAVSDDRVRLIFDHEQLVPGWIQEETPAIVWDRLLVEGYLSIESTNKEALRLARQGAPAGTLVGAEEQTAGRGRNERIWYSPARAGLYFSLVLRPGQPRRVWPLLTHVASVALAETLKALPEVTPIPGPLEVDIKWPNDVLLSGRKCAGILLETDQPDEGEPAAVVGVGVNVHATSVPASLASDATCLDAAACAVVPRRRLLVSYLYRFQRIYREFEAGNYGEVLGRWKSLSSMWNGAAVRITDGARCREAVTCGLDDTGALLVRTADGNVETVLAGDIRVRRAAEPGKS